MSEAAINARDGQVSEASLELLVLARRVASACPAEFGEEIALIGSAGWGVADEDSDLDLAIWTEPIPPYERLAAWLVELGGEQIRLDEGDNPDHALNVICRLEGVWLELGFYTPVEYEHTLEQILAGEATGRAQLLHAWNVTRATSLRTQGLLAGWQVKLSAYPDVLQSRIITESTNFWRFPHRVEMLWTLARRGALMGLDQWLFADLEDAMRVLYAANRQWEPDWKNLASASRLLELKPPDLIARLERIFNTADPKGRVAQAQQLILDVLALVPVEHDVSEAAANLRASLQAHDPVYD